MYDGPKDGGVIDIYYILKIAIIVIIVFAIAQFINLLPPLPNIFN